MKGNKLVLILVLIFVIVLLINIPIVSYLHRSVGYNFQAKVDQCQSALDNYDDKLPDLINYERTNTDNNAINSLDDFKDCRAITQHPEHYIRGQYIGFWVTVIIANVFILAFIAIFGSLFWMMSDSY